MTCDTHYSVVARVEPELEDFSDELRREEWRLEDRRDPCVMLLRVSLEVLYVGQKYPTTGPQKLLKLLLGQAPQYGALKSATQSQRS